MILVDNLSFSSDCRQNKLIQKCWKNRLLILWCIYSQKVHSISDTFTQVLFVWVTFTLPINILQIYLYFHSSMAYITLSHCLYFHQNSTDTNKIITDYCHAALCCSGLTSRYKLVEITCNPSTVHCDFHVMFLYTYSMSCMLFQDWEAVLYSWVSL